MNNGTITQRQGFMILGLFILSGGMIVGCASRNMPFILLAAAALSVPLFGLYTFLGAGKRPLDVFDYVFGKGGKILCLFYGVTALAVAASVIGVFTRFVISAGIMRGNSWLFALIFGVAAFFLATCTIETLGRTGAIIFPMAAALLIVTLLPAIGQGDFANLMPILRNAGGRSAETLFTVITSLFGQGFFAIMLLAPAINGKTAFGISGIAMGLILAVNSACNIAVLGFPAIMNYFYPIYTAASAVSFGTVLQRMEIFTAAAFLLCQLFKAAICIMFASAAFHRVFPGAERKSTLVFTAATVVGGQLAFGTLLQMSERMITVKYLYIIPLYILPVLMAGLKYRKQKR